MVDSAREEEAEIEAEKPYDASDPEAVNTARRRAGRKKFDALRVVHALMQHKDGRKWIYSKLEACHIFSTPFEKGYPDASSFRMGEQNIGLQFLAEVVSAAPEQYVLMCQENK